MKFDDNYLDASIIVPVAHHGLNVLAIRPRHGLMAPALLLLIILAHHGLLTAAWLLAVT